MTPKMNVILGGQLNQQIYKHFNENPVILLITLKPPPPPPLPGGWSEVAAQLEVVLEQQVAVNHKMLRPKANDHFLRCHFQTMCLMKN